MTAARPISSIPEVRDRIRKAGLRSTSPRIAVYLRLEQATTPLTHNDLAEGLDEQGFDKATIYRNLMDLTKAGIVSRSDLGDHVWRFELLRDESQLVHTHPHFTCETCGQVQCLPDVTVTISSASGQAHPPAFGAINQVLLKGVCDRCQ